VSHCVRVYVLYCGRTVLCMYCVRVCTLYAARDVLNGCIGDYKNIPEGPEWPKNEVVVTVRNREESSKAEDCGLRI
jgi:hypothetical protein